MKNEIPQIGSVGPQCQRLFAFLAASVLNGRQPTLYSCVLDMHTDADSVVAMLDRLQKFGLLTYRLEDGLRVEIAKRPGCAVEFRGEVE